MGWKAALSSTGLSWSTSTWRSPWCDRLWCRPEREEGPPLFLRRENRPAVHLHPIKQVYITRKTQVVLRQEKGEYFLFLPVLFPEGRKRPPRPALAVQRLLRLFSMESARRELQPFYSGIVRGVLREEQERYKSRPTQAISLIWNLFGRPQAFRTLTSFFISAAEKMGSRYYPALTGQNVLYLAAGVLLHSRAFGRYARREWEEKPELLRFPPPAAVHRPLEEEVIRRERESASPPPVLSAPLRMGESELRLLAEGVARALERQTRLETLRKGGGEGWPL